MGLQLEKVLTEHNLSVIALYNQRPLMTITNIRNGFIAIIIINKQSTEGFLSIILDLNAIDSVVFPIIVHDYVLLMLQSTF